MTIKIFSTENWETTITMTKNLTATLLHKLTSGAAF